jgi:hypothetical protein
LDSYLVEVGVVCKLRPGEDDGSVRLGFFKHRIGGKYRVFEDGVFERGMQK